MGRTHVFSHLSVIAVRCVSSAASRAAPSGIPLAIQRVRKPIIARRIVTVRMGF